MKLQFEKSPFFASDVTDLLRELAGIGFFRHGLLIGSWPMVVYAAHFTLMYGLATGDIDFAVTAALKVPAKPSETIPQVLERLGYSAIYDYKTGIETFLHGEFEVEFLTHRKGGGRRGEEAIIMQPWKVAAQPLPFIDILFIRPVPVVIEEFSISIPSPEALMLHKLIIAQRRTGNDRHFKKDKDLQQCSVLAGVARSEEVQQLLAEYRMSREVQKEIETSCVEAGIAMPGGVPWRPGRSRPPLRGSGARPALAVNRSAAAGKAKRNRQSRLA